MNAPRAAPGPLAVLLALTGLCAAALEVVWIRQAALLLGNPTLAVALGLAVFLVGTALAPKGDRRLFRKMGTGVDLPNGGRGPVRWFAGSTLAAAFAALVTTRLLGTAPSWVGASPLPVRIAVTVLLLLLPALALGGVLPSGVRAVSRSNVARTFGASSAVHTLGAAVGCFVVGFFALGRFGLEATALAASVTLVFVACLALLIAIRAAPVELEDAPVFEVPEVIGRRGQQALVASFVLTGAIAASFELLWFRVLSAALESTAYAFTVLVSTVLLGLVVGAWLYAARLSEHERPLELFVAVLAMLALVGLFSMALLGQQRLLAQALGPSYPAMILRAMLVVLLPSTLLGLSLPLMAQLGARHLSRGAGWILPLHRLGGAAGALLTALVLIPLLGAQRTFLVAAGASLAVALWAQRLDPRAKARRLYVAIVLCLAGFLLLPPRYLLEAQAQFSDSRILEAREGRDATVAVLEYDRQTLCDSGLYPCSGTCPGDVRYRQLLVGSLPAGSTALPLERTLRAEGHLPMLLHPDPKQVLVLGFGTGTVAGAFTAHESLRALTVVDGTRDLLRLAPRFEQANRKVLYDARTTPVIDDPRHFLRASDARFDVIAFEAPPPRAAGATTLYARELYALASSRLGDGGIVAQTIALDRQDARLTAALLKAITETFPEVQLWVPARLEAVVLASNRPLRIDLSAWHPRWELPAVKESLAEVGYDEPEALIGAFLLGDAAVRKLVADVAPLTDDRPATEFFLSSDAPPFDGAALLAAAESPAVIVPGADGPILQDLEAWSQAHHHYVQGHLLGRRGEKNLAWDQLELGSRLVGDNVFTDFMKNLEYGCLVRQPKPRTAK